MWFFSFNKKLSNKLHKTDAAHKYEALDSIRKLVIDLNLKGVIKRTSGMDWIVESGALSEGAHIEIYARNSTINIWLCECRELCGTLWMTINLWLFKAAI